MKKSIFLFVFLSCCASALAQESTLFLGKTNEEAKLLTELSNRRQELDKREEILQERQNEIAKQEKLYQKMTGNTFAPSVPRNVQIYMNMKPNKAAILLEKKNLLEAKYILNQMPAVYAARILNYMDETKAALLIDKNSNIKD